MPTLSHRWVRRTVVTVTALVVLALLFVAALPVGLLKGRAEASLSARFGRPVTIGGIERSPALSFTPTIRVRDIHIPQAGWAGRGDLARIGTLTLRIRALQLLIGRVDPTAITVSGARLNLVRAADGRVNWSTARDESRRGPFKLDGLTIRDTIVTYRDAKQNRRFTLALTADARGVAARGVGSVRGAAVRIALAGATVTAGDRPWPFRARIDGPALAMQAQGTMDSALDTDRMTLTITARAADLKLIDAVIEAGLFGTQPVRVSARVRHDGPRWRIDDLTGTIGRSDVSGRLNVDKSSGRTVLDGVVRSRALDFDDLADDRGLAAAAALERVQGVKLVPNMRVNLAKIDDTDGRIDFRIDRIVSRRRPSSLTSVAGTVRIDRQRMTVAPLRVGLAGGAIGGTVTVDQRGDHAVPTVTLAIDLTGGSVAALAGGGDVNGRLDARVRLTGRGSTIREAVGRSAGRIGIVARDGVLPAKLAATLGFDAARAITTGDAARATLRCAIMRLEVTDGHGRFAPLIVDTDAGQTRGAGGVSFPSESIAATLTGAPKRSSLLRVPGSVIAGGTLRDPKIVVPAEVKSFGNMLKGIGRAITRTQGPVAADIDCTALSRAAIGR